MISTEPVLAGRQPHHPEGSAGREVGRSLLGAVGWGVGRVFDLVGALRGGRAIHPVGAVLRGRLVRDGVRPGATPTGVAWLDTAGDDEVPVRLSRGGGLPAPLPDVQGLALRHDGADLLLSSTLAPPVLRHLPVPALTPGRPTYGSLMPFVGPRGTLLLGARPAPRRALRPDPDGLAQDTARTAFVLELVWARPLGPWQPFGRLELAGPWGPTTDGPTRYDPRQAPPGLRVPDWIVRLRAPSYAAARRPLTPAEIEPPPTGTAPAPITTRRTP